MSPWTSLLDLAAGPKSESRAIALRFLVDGEVDGPRIEWTYAELGSRVDAVAQELLRRGLRGQSVILLFPSGLDFVAGFLGALKAGAIAVPAYPPDPMRLDRSVQRLSRIIGDCGATAVLSNAATAALCTDLSAGRGDLAWILSEDLISADAPVRAPAADEEVAFLQYTSGSTDDPKGVMVSRRNVRDNLASMQATWGSDADAEFVCWLPHYHDMGLLAGLLYPLSIRATSTLMSPQSFVQRPLRWLEAISRFGATFSIAPNFAYDLCVRKSDPADLAALDLSRWRQAGNGAEPVRMDTIDRFAQRFATTGFRRQAFAPAYGLAEATLMVTTVRPGETPRPAGDDRRSVACGEPAPGVQVVIVDAATGQRCRDGQVGEVWVRGTGTALGYWNRPEDTREAFGAHLPDGQGPFLRTGDLGFLDQGELCPTGRVKDLIILEGVNHYPQDLERSTELSSPGIRAGCVAAFALDDGGGEVLAIVAEWDGREEADAQSTVAAIRAGLVDVHDIAPAVVALIAPRTIPKTSSGKIRRRETREQYLAGTLQVRSLWRGTDAPVRGFAEVQAWLLAQLSLRAGIDPRRIDTDAPFRRYGLGSIEAIALSGDLARWLARPVSATAVYEFPTIDTLASALSPDGPAHGTSVSDPGQGGSRHAADEAVAIVGIAARYPGSADPEGFWRLLADGEGAIGAVPADRWDVEAYLTPGEPVPGRMYTARGGFLDEVAGFDPEFFGISHTEAKYLDPQQRLLLELAWEALEDAGTLPQAVAGTAAGVFIGMTTGDYADLMKQAGIDAGPYAGTGNVSCMAANRISFTFDLRGPSLALDTACSSSLVAIHYACESIRRGECDTALAGGVNLMLSPATTVALCQGGALSADGQCFTFDDRANGYVRGEGAGLVLLKPLQRAQDDGDRIYAVIRGSAVNQDGRSNGLTAPNPEAHRQVIRQAFARASMAPSAAQYIEAHGTGTALGDPIEAGAIGAAIAGRAADPVAIGSAKTNIGHLEAAAGVAGLTKVALALHHAVLPASRNFERPNPHIDLPGLGLCVPTAGTPWPAPDGHRVAGVNSFGVGGVNAHVVLTDAGKVTPRPSRPGPGLFVLSGRTPQAVRALAQRCADSLQYSKATLEELCATTAMRRVHHEHRLAVVARTPSELAASLAEPGNEVGLARKDHRPRLLVVFPGQGSQYVAMGQVLYRNDPAYRAAFDACAEAMQPYLDWSLIDELFASDATSRLKQDAVVQPFLFAVQVALAATWSARGVRPDAVLGHSMGEVAAAHVAGALDLQDAARVTCRRANLLRTLSGRGGMAVVALSRTDVESELTRYGDQLCLAAANAPELSVVSGQETALEDFLTRLNARDVFCRRINAGGAGHSPVVDDVARQLAEDLQDLRPTSAGVAIYSSVTAEPIDGESLTCEYWRRNLRDPVLFGPAIERAGADGYELVLELSPNPTLMVGIEQTLAAAGVTARVVGSLNRKLDDQQSLLDTFGVLWAHGLPVDWTSIHPDPRPVVSLPSGPWHRRRFWFDESDYTTDDSDNPVSEPVGMQEIVARAFADVLRVRPVAPHDSFFDLGGTSLMAAQMLHELRTALQRHIPLRVLFDNPSAAALAGALADATTIEPDLTTIERIESDDYPVTINQERYLHAELRDQRAFVVTQHLLIDGPLDVARLEQALRTLVTTHDGLRTVFARDPSGSLRQRLAEHEPLALPLMDLSAALDPQAALAAYLREAEQPFALFDGPLHRFGLVRLGTDRHLLAVVLHHLITDGWSQGVLHQDLVTSYAGDTPSVPPVRLVDVASWQFSRHTGAMARQRMQYWRDLLADVRPPTLDIVDEAMRGHVESRTRLVEAVIDQEIELALEATARDTNTTMQMVMLTGFMLALSRHSDDDQVAVPINVSARERPQLERVVGFLSQMRLIVVDFAGHPTNRECLRRVRDAVLEAGEHQDLSMSEFFHLAGVRQDDVPYRISMNFLPPVELPFELGEATMTLAPRQSSYLLPRDILLIVRRAKDRLHLSFGYAAGIVDERGMAVLVADMTDALTDLATALDKPATPTLKNADAEETVHHP